MRCRRGKRVVRHVRGVCVSWLTGAVVALLVGNKAGTSLCDACVAFTTECSLADVRHVLDTLTPFAEFRRSEAMCAVCSGIKKVTEARVDGSAPDVTEGLRYRGWHMKVLSYRLTPSRWRSLVMMKAPRGADTPDAASLIQATFSSCVEAARYAVHAANEWVDKHSGQSARP